MIVASRRGVGATDQGGRAAGRLAECELGGRGELVGHGTDRRAHDPAVVVGDAAQVLERRQARHADRDVDDAPAPRPAERVAHDDGKVDPEAALDGLPNPRRGGVGVVRQERDDLAAGRADVGGVDPAVGADEAVRGLRDEHAVRHPDDPPGLAQDDLDLAGVAIPALGKLDGLRARFDRRQVDDRALGLGDDLLGHDEDVVRSEQHREAGGPLDGVAQEPAQVVAGPDLRDPPVTDDLDRGLDRSAPGRFPPVSGHRPSRS